MLTPSFSGERGQVPFVAEAAIKEAMIGFPMAREYLEQVRKAEEKVRILEERLINLEMLISDTSAPPMETRIRYTPDPHRGQTLQALKDEHERMKIRAEAEAAAIRDEVTRTLNWISDPTAQRVLMLHSLMGLSWKQIGKKIGYSRSQIFRYRDRGYTEVEEMLKERCWTDDAEEE